MQIENYSDSFYANEKHKMHKMSGIFMVRISVVPSMIHSIIGVAKELCKLHQRIGCFYARRDDDSVANVLTAAAAAGDAKPFNSPRSIDEL